MKQPELTNPVAPTYCVWAHCARGWQCRCQEDPVSLPSGRLDKTSRTSLHHEAQHRPTGSETPGLSSLKWPTKCQVGR